MNILVLGGTQFVGRHIAQQMIEAGHTVSIFNRGKTADDLPAHVERICGDRDLGMPGLDSLSNRSWDLCIDVSGFTAIHVRASAGKLRNHVGHYVFISAVSVYGDPKSGPVRETHPRVSPGAEEVTEINAETYGRLKVTCEDIVQDLYPGRCALLRPQIVAGPYDPYDRFSYWVRRSSQGGEMLAPGDGSDYVQFIDADDVARFTSLVIEKALTGPFNLAGARLQWREFLNLIGAQNLVWVPAEMIKSAGITEFELPLYRPNNGPRSSLMHVSNARALEAGLTITGTRITAEKVRSWLPRANLTPALSLPRESELIRLSRGD